MSLDPERVWRIERDLRVRALRIVPSGTLLLNDKHLLDVDFGSFAGVIDRPFRKRSEEVDLAIAPWSHRWAGYYPFLMFVVGKLCRIKDALEESDWDSAGICYPMLDTVFEREYLMKLGVDRDALIDTRRGIRLNARSAVVANNQPSWLPSPTTVSALRRHLLSQAPNHDMRIYVSRQDMRRVRNEGELLRVLAAFDFQIVDEMPESVDEQIGLFNSASIVITPHGAALANLVWCRPGTHVIEFFSGSYTRSTYYYLSTLLGLRYSYLVDASRKPTHWTSKKEDVTVDARVVEKLLAGITQANG